MDLNKKITFKDVLKFFGIKQSSKSNNYNVKSMTTRNGIVNTIVSGNNISVINGVIYVDGKKQELGQENPAVINITVENSVSTISVDVANTITAKSYVGNVYTQSGDIQVDGDVDGDVNTASGNVTIGSYVTGNVKTVSGNIKAGSIQGNASTLSGNVRG
jgi:hypothetical protein